MEPLLRRFGDQPFSSVVAYRMLIHGADLPREVRRALRWIGRHPDSDSALDLEVWASGETLETCLRSAHIHDAGQGYEVFIAAVDRDMKRSRKEIG